MSGYLAVVRRTDRAQLAIWCFGRLVGPGALTLIMAAGLTFLA